MNVLWQLFYEFFIMGAFAVGGGLATLPFLYKLVEKYDWFTMSQLVDMIAISESTPGPLGINMATFAGYRAGDIFGGIVATLGIIVPSLFIIIAIAKVLTKFKESKFVQYAFYGIRPAVAALILSAAMDVMKLSLVDMNALSVDIMKFFNFKAIALFVIIYVLLKKYKKHPVVYIGMAAVVGMVVSIY